VFPKHRLLETPWDCAKPYRLAFARDLLPGVGCNFALLLGPAVQGLAGGTHTSPPTPSLLAGTALLLAGAALIGAGVHAIGIARIFFVYEYMPATGPVMRGVYRVIRHPLFLGGELASIGLALCIGTPDALMLAAVNLLVLPAYVLLEDRRSAKVMGDAYAGYRNATGAVIPRGRRR
jgi:protein-S-isoprenylcysteine O-methyltransferase Ste14